MTTVAIDALLVTTVVVLVGSTLVRPLRRVLVDLCGSEVRARVWLAMSETALATGTLLSAAVCAVPASWPGVPPGRLAWPLRGAVAGALAGLTTLAAVVAGFERRSRRDV
jgi:hypothetical protein